MPLCFQRWSISQTFCARVLCVMERRFAARGGVKELAPAAHRSSLGEVRPLGRAWRAHRRTLRGAAGLSRGDGRLPHPRRPGIPSLPETRSYRPSVGTRIPHTLPTSRCRTVKEFGKRNVWLPFGPPFLGPQPLLFVMAVSSRSTATASWRHLLIPLRLFK